MSRPEAREDAPTLGLSSLDQLRELREAEERRTAAGRRGVVELRVGEVHPDPDQVRRDFHGDVVAEDDAAGLEGLAKSIAAVGVHNPIHVRSDDDLGGYRIVSGERRWRAAGMAGLEVVPCLVDDETEPQRNTLVQLTENLQRSDLKLLDVAAALERALEETGLTQAALARELGKSKSWVSKHLALLRFAGAAEEALAENRLGSVELARLYGRLPADDQERLLARSRKAGLPIPHSEVVRLEKRRRAAKAAAKVAEEPAPPGDDATPSGEPVADDPIHVLRLTTPQMEALLRRLGGDVGAPSFEEEVLRLLAA